MNVGETAYGISEELFNYLKENYEFDDELENMFTKTLAVVGENKVYFYMLNNQNFSQEDWDDFLVDHGIFDQYEDLEFWGIGGFSLVKSNQSASGL